MPEVKKHIWTREVERAVTHADTATFLDGIKDQSKYVSPVGVSGDIQGAVIHSTFFGVKPDVLINNTTYPIDIQALEGEDFTVSLDKYQTKATPITDDELYGIAYDKIANVRQSHSEAIAERKHDKALHALAPEDNDDGLVLHTTGADDGTGRKRLIRKDVVALKKAMDNAKLPKRGRRLVFCNDHINDLLIDDQKFADQYYNYTTGKIANLYGFEVFEYDNCPIYNEDLEKKSFGASAIAGEFEASVAFVKERAVKASGVTLMYFSKSENDTLYQRNLVNFRHYFIVLPTAVDTRAALVSAVVEEEEEEEG